MAAQNKQKDEPRGQPKIEDKPVIKPPTFQPVNFGRGNFRGFNTKGFTNPAAMTKTQHKG